MAGNLLLIWCCNRGLSWLHTVLVDCFDVIQNVGSHNCTSIYISNYQFRHASIYTLLLQQPSPVAQKFSNGAPIPDGIRPDARSSSAISPSDSRQPSAPAISLSWESDLAPGMGSVPLQMHQLREICRQGSGAAVTHRKWFNSRGMGVSRCAKDMCGIGQSHLPHTVKCPSSISTWAYKSLLLCVLQ